MDTRNDTHLHQTPNAQVGTEWRANAAQKQISLIASDIPNIARIRAIHSTPRKTGKKRPVIEFVGGLESILERAETLNNDGYNIYMMAQSTHAGSPERQFVRDTDIVGIRCLYVDGDDVAFPATWHVEPTFVLKHPTTNRWWAFWTVSDFPPDRLRNAIRELAHMYGGDPNVCNLSRIVRLAGFDRWKNGQNFGPYELEVVSGEPSDASDHLSIQEKAHDKQKSNQNNCRNAIELDRLKKLLLYVPPFERGDWLRMMFMIRDGRVLNQDGKELDDWEKLELFDAWSSGELYEEAKGGEL